MENALEKFEKAILWKVKKDLDASWDVELCLDAASKPFVGVVSIPAIRPKTRGDMEAYGWTSAHFLYKAPDVQDFCLDWLTVDVEPSQTMAYFSSLNEHDKRKMFGIVPASDFEKFGPEMKKLVLEALWKAASTGVLKIAMCGDSLPSPEQIILEWTVANG